MQHLIKFYCSKANQISYLLFTSLRNENAFDLSYSCNHRLCRFHYRHLCIIIYTINLMYLFS